MKRHWIMAIACATMAMGVMGCDKEKKGEEEAAAPQPAIDMEALDLSTSPKEDFYQYVNGGWMAANPLPAEYARYGSFDMLREKAEYETHAIMEEMKEGLVAGSEEEKAYRLYEMSIDEEKLNADGATPILPYLSEVDQLTSKEKVVDYLAKSANYGDNFLFATYVSPDEKNSTQNMLQLVQPGLIMGVPDYYKEGETFAKQQADYRTYIARLFELTGTEASEAEAIAQQVFETEKSLSEIVYTMLELRDTERNYNKMALSELYSTFKFPWQCYFEGRTGIAGATELNVCQKDYFHRFDGWFDAISLEQLKNLFKANILDSGASLLSKDFRDASFAFHSTSMAGITEQKPLWKLGVNRVNRSMGDVIGKKYVAKYFPQEAKDKMTKLVDNLIVALGKRIDNLSWMGEETKAKAHEKLSTFIVKIGYPNKWWDYSELQLVDSSLYEYMRSIALFGVNQNNSDLGKPVDRDRWFMNAHEVNAYYNPTTNEICFPAGILQPPFFNLNADDAVNYGGIGVVIGHEMTHGFDDQGSQFDAQGNMLNWWTEADKATFTAATQKLAEQFSQVEIKEGLMADGHLTLGENIADQGGVLVAFDALQQATEGEEYPEIDGLTKEQCFFIGYARLWGQNITDEEMVRLTKVDVHSLGKLRVNQTLKNIDAFYHAFGIQEGDPMYMAPEERVIVW